MKKWTLKIGIIFSALLLLTGCNKNIVDLNLKFDKIHLYETPRCYDIKEWNDYDGEQIKVKLTDGTILLTSTQKAILVNGTCPICNH